jgi:hypothetical protein
VRRKWIGRDEPSAGRHLSGGKPLEKNFKKCRTELYASACGSDDAIALGRGALGRGLRRPRENFGNAN